MLETGLRNLLKNKEIQESIPTITMVLVVWLIGTLFIVMQDYKNTIISLEGKLTTLRVEISITQQKIKELQLLCIDAPEYFRKSK